MFQLPDFGLSDSFIRFQIRISGFGFAHEVSDSYIRFQIRVSGSGLWVPDSSS